MIPARPTCSSTKNEPGFDFTYVEKSKPGFSRSSVNGGKPLISSHRIDCGGTYPKSFGVGIRARICSSSSAVTRLMPLLRQVDRARKVRLKAGHHRYTSFCFESGNSRIRLPVAAKIAFPSAAITGGNPGSPTPVGSSPLSTKCTFT